MNFFGSKEEWVLPVAWQVGARNMGRRPWGIPFSLAENIFFLCFAFRVTDAEKIVAAENIFVSLKKYFRLL